ncbi:MAG TPA: nucleotidyltransferase domain-containing protein [Candidatus Nanoarchaeia archaeon]|nr:nucleotidyltransferase domain-containing protein [Candidatus Nanoarchaeia archaeon]
MMLTPKQIKIFEAFLSKPYKELTYKEIKDYSNEKSNSIIQKAMVKFLAEELVKKREVGNIILYAVNLDSSTVFSYFDILIKEKTPNLVKRSLRIIREELSNIEFASIVIFGSYAEGKQKEKSDLDIAIFVNSIDDKKNCRSSMKSAELKSILQIDAHIITKNEMLQMLKDKHENLGKQIAYKHLAIQNPMIFYSILAEGINNGFKIVYS